MDLKGLLCALEEKLSQHDNSRKEVQDRVKEICSEVIKEADSLEERANEDIHNAFDGIEERIFVLIEKLNNFKDNDDENESLDSLTKQAQEILSFELKYEIKCSKWAENFISKYKLIISTIPTNKVFDLSNTPSRIEYVISQLQEHLDKAHEAINAMLDKYSEICTDRRNEAEELVNKINGKLEPLFAQEDAMIQGIVNMVREKIDNGNFDEQEELKIKARNVLTVIQKYIFKDPHVWKKGRLCDNYDVDVIKEYSLKYFDFDKRKPSNITPLFTNKREFSPSFSLFTAEENSFLEKINLTFNVTMKLWEKKCQNECDAIIASNVYIIGEQPTCFDVFFKHKTEYYMKMRIGYSDLLTEWSDVVEFTSQEFKQLCTWKKCSGDTDEKYKYSVDENNHRIATRVGSSYRGCSIIIGNTFLPPSEVTLWNIKIVKSNKNNGKGIYIGIAPFDINQNENCHYNKYGWYFSCYYSTLYSGPPYNYENKGYGPRKKLDEKYVYNGDSVGVVMDTTKGELSFILNNVNLGIAYEGIPLDKPLVPCTILGKEGDSVELII